MSRNNWRLLCLKNLGYTDAPFYEKTKDEYDIESRRGQERFKSLVELLSKHLPIKSGRVLDIGCNAGLSSFALEELGFEVVGVDIDGKAIEKARENAKLRNSKAQFYVMDAKRLEFDDESFDLVVTLGYNLPHFSIYDFDEIVREAYRVLKPDGAIIVDYSDFVKALSAGIIKDVYVEEPFIAYHKGFDFKESSRELYLMIDMPSFDVFAGRMNVRRITIRNGRRREVSYSIRLYTFTELKELLKRAGFEVYKVFGHWNERQLSLNAPRIIVVAQKV